MSEKSDSGGLKSAYERALERLEADGIEPPREQALDAETRAAIAAERQKAEARLAELEILHQDRRSPNLDPEERLEAEEEYRAERQRIRAAAERAVARLRGD